MAEYSLFPAKVVTPEGVLFDGEVRELEVTSISGGLGILARRAPIVADLKIGRIRAQLEDGSWTTWASAEGFAQASNSTATVIVEEAVPVDSITPAYVDEALTRAHAELATAEGKGDATDTATAQRSIAWCEHLRSVADIG